jgi:hypothetical protein
MDIAAVQSRFGTPGARLTRIDLRWLQGVARGGTRGMPCRPSCRPA